jgi:hypothetical protein
VRAALVALALSACNPFASPPVCTSADDWLVPGDEGLSCADADVATRYVAALAGRPVRRADRALLLRDLGTSYQADAGAVRADLAAMRATLVDLSGRNGLDAAEARSARAWTDLTEGGPLRRHSQAARVLSSAIAVWASDDEEKLVLTEADIEGWIQYASLCREVQAGGPLKLSVAQREGLYRELRTRFRDAPRDEQVAMVAVGPFWQGVTSRWQAASYDKQQAWARTAPLPPPMTASSLVYAQEVLALPAVDAARTLHEHLGPIPLDGVGP